MNKTKKPLPTKPLFTHFLEQQQLQEVTGAGPNQTLKYPSDSDEGV